MGDFIYYKTSSPAGDLISFLSGVKQMHKETGKRGIIYQRLDMVGTGYPDSIHPYQNEAGEPVCMTKKVFDMLAPLLKSQPYIEDYLVYLGQQVDFDFDVIRLEHYTGQPRGSLNRWFNYPFPQMASDLSKPWILANPLSTNMAVINFTQRYRNHVISYQFLNNYKDNIIFAGLENEHQLFCKQHGLDIPLLEVTDFKQLADTISGAKLFMGNASMCFQLAEAMKIPRILETFPMMPNVIPIGEHAYDFYGQRQVEYYFDKLFNL